MPVPQDTYETLRTAVIADFAYIEANTTGDVLARVIRLHSRAVWAGQKMDAHFGIVRAEDGEPKPPPHP